MVELCLMIASSSSYVPGLLFHHEQALCRSSKEVLSVVPSSGRKQEILRSGTRSPMGWLFSDQSDRKPVLIDVQDTRPDSMHFSFGISEHYTRREKIMQYLVSGSSVSDKDGLDFSLLSSLTGLQTSAIEMRLRSLGVHGDGRYLYEVGDDESQPSVVYPSDYYMQKPLLDPMADSALFSKIRVHPDGRALFTGTEIEMKDFISVFAEFYPSKKSVEWRKQSLLVPHFTRYGYLNPFMKVKTYRETRDRATYEYSWIFFDDGNHDIFPFEKLLFVYTLFSAYDFVVGTGKPKAGPIVIVRLSSFPLVSDLNWHFSPETVKLKPSPKKRSSRKAGREKDLCRRSSFHAFECLLSLILDKRCGKEALLSVKQSGSELPPLLTQFSAGIAGTGLAVIFSVVLNVSSRKAPFCAPTMLNTGFGFGLVWLSWGVNKLRDTIAHISKSSSKPGFNEKDMMRNVDRSVNDIFLRAATIMAIAVLRFA
ncbi:hypothetical protein IFM89_026853 [Coptis chinensis]|uniref:Uncharacterized protein n=1 Tax=Coptis chinensis TaxID=261450 RepID=A0A835HXN0_9MAGN|nr:hypothetical protein IFM89_026853 [Coptis chinensis]